MLNKKQFIWYLLGYFLLRFFAYFWSPTNLANQLVAGVLLFGTLYLIAKKDWRGWLVVAGEIILGGGGGYLACFDIALRTWLLFGSLFIYFFQIVADKNAQRENSYFARQFGAPLILLLLVAGFAAINGIINHHALRSVFADFVPYLFVLYIFPLLHAWTQPNFRTIIFNMVVAAIVGNCIFILLTFVGFSSGFFVVQTHHFYNFFRDVAGGKITPLGFNFFRIVLNEQLLLSPLLIYFIGKQTAPPLQKMLDGKMEPTEKGNKIYVFLALALTVILTLSLTRAYMLAIFVGLIFLLRRTNWKRVLVYTCGITTVFLLVFFAIHFVASGGTNWGWELLGGRTAAIVSPQNDDSGLSRLLILPAVWEKVKSAPFFGTGLGDTITVFSPVLQKQVTTSNFDWGYFEIMAEMGTIGVLGWLFFGIYLIYNIFKNKLGDNKRILLATLAAMAIINITSPACTHVMGVIWWVVLMSPLGWYSSASSGGVIVSSKKEIAVVANRNSHTWSFPKGNIEKGEEVLSATTREIYEETGLSPDKLQVVRLLGEYERLTFIPRYNLFIHKNISLFLVKADGELKPIDPDNPEAKWVKKDEVEKIITHPKDKEFFRKIADQI